MKCLVIETYSGIYSKGRKGQEVNLPMSEAKDLQKAGIVKILEDYKPEMAYETAEAARIGVEERPRRGRKCRRNGI